MIYGSSINRLMGIFMVELVPIDSIEPSTYNPRSVDAYRLELIALSLRKLGFVLPIYVTPEGEILSGHQRHLVADTFLGLESVPVEYTQSFDMDARRNVNVLFNRGTNDMDSSTNSFAMTSELMIRKLHDLAKPLPDRKGANMFPCLRERQADIRPLLKANKGRWRQYPAIVAKYLRTRKIKMPLVVNEETNVVVNGIGRLELAARDRARTVPVVYVSAAEHEFTDAMLNFLSMDFDLHTRYADLMRHNSFRRSTWSSFKFGNGYAAALGSDTFRDFDHEDPEFQSYFSRRFGRNLLDMGAGHHARPSFREWFKERFETNFYAFEPYVVPDGTGYPEVEFTRDTVRDFLQAVRDGVMFNSIVAFAVLNSIPFHQDRRYFLAICASLCAPSTVYYTTAASLWMMSRNVTGGGDASFNSSQSTIFGLDYEPNVTIAEWNRSPKAQKYFEMQEFQRLLLECWEDVETRTAGALFATCKRPRRPNLRFLADALVFEFDVPFKDGLRLGLAEEALDAFSERLGVRLEPTPPEVADAD